MNRAKIKPELLRWACERSRIDKTELDVRFPQLRAWVQGEKQPTFRQLEIFARTTHTPIGFLFLPEAPEEKLPLRDFRTTAGESSRPSADLLDTVYAMQRRQQWLRQERIDSDAGTVDVVGSARLIDDPVAIGQEMRRMLGFENGWASRVSSWESAVSELRQAIERIGITVVINGVVGNNTSRKLDVREFRGFAVIDAHAPLIFVNGADSKSAQMFTLAHELAHVWLGSEGEGVSGFDGIFPGSGRIETFCDQAAAEFLVPAREMKEKWKEVRGASDPFVQAARFFKVSPVVAGRRAMDLRLVNRETFFQFYRDYTGQQQQREKGAGGGGDFYNNQNTRIGKPFALSVIHAALEGRLSFKEAYALTDLHGGAFQEYARRLGVWLP